MDKSGVSAEEVMCSCTCLAAVQVVLQDESGQSNTVKMEQLPPYCICAFEYVCCVCVCVCVCVHLSGCV